MNFVPKGREGSEEADKVTFPEKIGDPGRIVIVVGVDVAPELEIFIETSLLLSNWKHCSAQVLYLALILLHVPLLQVLLC